MTWAYLQFGKVKSHAASHETANAVILEMGNRGHKLTGSIIIPSMFMDEPGMICTTRPIEEIDFEGLALHVPSEDIAAFVLRLDELQSRVVGEVTFYKLHDWNNILCLSEREYDLLKVKLKALLPAAETRAAEFYAINKLPSEVLREANAKVAGVPVEEMPNYGANKCDRFKPKNGGTA